MRLALGVVVPHVLEGRERRLHRDVEALVARVGDRRARGDVGDVGFAVLFRESMCQNSWSVCVCMLYCRTRHMCAFIGR